MVMIMLKRMWNQCNLQQKMCFFCCLFPIWQLSPQDHKYGWSCFRKLKIKDNVVKLVTIDYQLLRNSKPALMVENCQLASQLSHLQVNVGSERTAACAHQSDLFERTKKVSPDFKGYNCLLGNNLEIITAGIPYVFPGNWAFVVEPLLFIVIRDWNQPEFST